MNIVLSVFGALLVAAVMWFLVEKARRRTHPVDGGIQCDINLPHRQEFELYSNSFSHCSRKVRLVLAELGIDYLHHPTDLIETGWYQTISANYLKINPAGLVPTFVHNGHPVYESDDILAYAQQVAPSDAPQLIPADETRRREMDAWISFCSLSSDDPMGAMEERAGACIPGLTLPLFATSIRYIPLRRILIGFLFHPDKKRPLFFALAKILGPRRTLALGNIARVVHASHEYMRGHLAKVETALEACDGPWILGADYSMADITLAATLLRLDECGWLNGYVRDGDFPNLSNYYLRLRARPNWEHAIEANRHSIIERAKTDVRSLNVLSN